MAGNKFFVDTNILVYANTINFPFCTMARNKLKYAFQTYDSVWISNQVMQEYLSFISLPHSIIALLILDIAMQRGNVPMLS